MKKMEKVTKKLQILTTATNKHKATIVIKLKNKD